MNDLHSDRYPHVVIRFMACCYGIRGVEFVAEPVGDGITALPIYSAGAFVIHGQLPSDGRLPGALRAALIEQVRVGVRESGHRMSVVCGPADAVFVEVDGSTVARREPPSGGVVLDGKVTPVGRFD